MFQSGAAAAFGAIEDVPCPSVSRPVQSWQKRGQEVVSISPGTPMLVAHRLPGVIRRWVDFTSLVYIGQDPVEAGQILDGAGAM